MNLMYKKCFLILLAVTTSFVPMSFAQDSIIQTIDKINQNSTDYIQTTQQVFPLTQAEFIQSSDAPNNYSEKYLTYYYDYTEDKYSYLKKDNDKLYIKINNNYYTIQSDDVTLLNLISIGTSALISTTDSGIFSYNDTNYTYNPSLLPKSTYELIEVDNSTDNSITSYTYNSTTGEKETKNATN